MHSGYRTWQYFHLVHNTVLSPQTNECLKGNHHTITKLKKEKEAQIATQIVKEQYHPFVRRLIFCKLICSLRSILLNLHQIIICLATVSESISGCTKSFCSKAPFARRWLARNLLSSSTAFTASSCHTAGCLQYAVQQCSSPRALCAEDLVVQARIWLANWRQPNLLESVAQWTFSISIP